MLVFLWTLVLGQGDRPFVKHVIPLYNNRVRVIFNRLIVYDADLEGN